MWLTGLKASTPIAHARLYAEIICGGNIVVVVYLPSLPSHKPHWDLAPHAASYLPQTTRR